MTTSGKISLSPMTVFDCSLTIPEMFELYNRFTDEGLNTGHAITYTRKTVQGPVTWVINTVRKDEAGNIVLDITEQYDNGTSYNREMFVEEFFNWIFD